MNKPAMKALAKNMLDPRYSRSSTYGCLRQTLIIHSQSAITYSILGVMADIYIRATKKAKWEESGELGKPDKLIVMLPEYSGTMGMEAWRLDLPEEILEWYGISRDEAAELWVAQTRGFSFEQLSKSIMKEVERG